MKAALKKKIFCFGELLLRFSPALGGEWISQSSMPVFIGGAELNVARALARWGMPAKYVTALPGHYLSKEITDHLQSKEIDVSSVLLTGDRIGTYYLPQGKDLKSEGVIYDRAGSSFAGLKTGMVNWEEALKDCNWFHFSAISPALNENVAAVCKEGLAYASSMGLTISVDLNYRSLLWQYEQPFKIMNELVPYCTVVMGNVWSAESLLQIKAPVKTSEGTTNPQLINAARQSMLWLQQQYPTASCIAYTFRLQHEYFAVFRNGHEQVISKIIPVADVKDKAGSGDCFMAGLIYGLQNNHSSQQIVDYAATAAVGKLQERGDATSQTVEEINSKLV